MSTNICHLSTLLAMLWMHTITGKDNLELLSGTLRTFQRAACDDQTAVLKCPPGTCISVQVAQYGKSSATVCPGPASRGLQKNISCLWPSTLQSVLLSSDDGTRTQTAVMTKLNKHLKQSLQDTVVEACQKKRQCKVHASPVTFGGDPCPGINKYIEIAFKCRPYEFRSKLSCENDVLQLRCNPNSRIAIYSSSFGRTEYENVRCPQPQGMREETCLVSYATETVMHLCHGKRRCTLSADVATFGNPCHHQSRLYLKVVYTCVPRIILQEKYDSIPEEDEPLQVDYDIEVGFDLEEGMFPEGDIYSESPNMAVAGRRLNNSNTYVAPTKTSPIQHHTYDGGFHDDQDKFIVYLIVCVSSSMLVLVLLLTVKLICYRQGRQHSSPDGTLSKTYAEEISQEETSIDRTNVSTPSAVSIMPGYPPAELMQYGPESETVFNISHSRSNHYYYG